jgi:hypothetical protein
MSEQIEIGGAPADQGAGDVESGSADLESMMYPTMETEPGTQTGEQLPKDQGDKANDRGEKDLDSQTTEQLGDLKIPEGLQVDEKQISDFKSFAEEQGLTPAQAQSILEFGGAKVKEMVERPYRVWQERQDRWAAQTKADRIIGGKNLDQNVRIAQLVFQPGESNPFVSSAAEARNLKAALCLTGLGDNPHVVRLFMRMGRYVADPSSLGGKPRLKNAQDRLLRNMYDKM